MLEKLSAHVREVRRVGLLGQARTREFGGFGKAILRALCDFTVSAGQRDLLGVGSSLPVGVSRLCKEIAAKIERNGGCSAAIGPLQGLEEGASPWKIR